MNDESFEAIEGTDDDVLSADAANLNEASIYSAGDPDDTSISEDIDEEDEEDE